MNVEDAFAKLKFDWEQKSSQIAALETQRSASQQRLEDNLKREAGAQTALRKINALLDQANQELSESRRAADKILTDAKAERDEILSTARKEAEKFLADVRTAVATTATMVRRKFGIDEQPEA
jgi:chromosome segregation ATPase